MAANTEREAHPDAVSPLQALRRIADLCRAVDLAEGIEEIYARALDTLQDALGASRAAVLLRDAEGVMRFTAWRGLSDRYREMAQGHSPWPADATDPQPVLVEDVTRDPDLAALQVAIVAEGIRSLAFVPLTARGKLIGKFMIYFDAPHAYTEVEVQLAANVAAQIGFALERKRVEEELRASRDQLAIILRSAADGVTVQQPDGSLLYANDAAARTLGYTSAEELVATPVGEIMQRFAVVSEDGKPFPLAQLPGRRALAGADVPPIPLRFRIRATGEERWSLVGATAVFDEQGRVIFAVNVFHDITAIKQAEQRLSLLADSGAVLHSSLDEGEILGALTRAATDSLADWCVVYLTGEQNAITLSAASHRDESQVELAEELIERYPPRPNDNSVLWRVLQTGEPVLLPELPDAFLARAAEDEEHLRLLRALGLTSVIWAPLMARGRTLGAMGLITTASGRRFQQEDLLLAQEIARRAALALDNARLYSEVQRALRDREEFLSIASHELRNPVAAIRGMAQLLSRAHGRGQLDAQRLERSLASLDATSARLASLTDDLLDVARIQSHAFPIHQETVDLCQIVREVVEARRPLAESRRLHLALGRQACPALVDPRRIEQVLINLLDNAVKYSPEGGDVHVSLEPEAEGARISIRDDGIGLPPESLERVFEPLRRAENALQRNIPGLGLGLYICRQIAQQHGGRLWAESRGEGQGTAMHLWLPLAEESAPLHPKDA